MRFRIRALVSQQDLNSIVYFIIINWLYICNFVVVTIVVTKDFYHNKTIVYFTYSFNFIFKYSQYSQI